MGSSRIEDLSPRGRDCLWGVHRGLTSKEIARELGIAEGTVTGYIRDAVILLDAPNRRAAARTVFGDVTPAPQNMGGQTLGLGGLPTPAETASRDESVSPWWGFVNVANRDVANELGIFERIGAIVFLTVGIAGGFGILAAAVRTISDLVGQLAGRG